MSERGLRKVELEALVALESCSWLAALSERELAQLGLLGAARSLVKKGLARFEEYDGERHIQLTEEGRRLARALLELPADEPP